MAIRQSTSAAPVPRRSCVDVLLATAALVLLVLNLMPSSSAPAADRAAASSHSTVVPSPPSHANDSAGVPRPTSTTGAPATSLVPSCWPGCLPLQVDRHAVHLVMHERDNARGRRVTVGPATPQGHLAFPAQVTQVVMEVGTNINPNSWESWQGVSSVGMIWLEPVTALLQKALDRAQPDSLNRPEGTRVFGFAAAVGSTMGYTTFFLSKEAGCNSLLRMNDDASEAALQRTFGSDNDSAQIFRHCVSNQGTLKVPVVRGDAVAALIPPTLSLMMLIVDAQGFDTQVAASFGASLRDFDVVILECQDLPQGHPMFLTRGALSCADQRQCMRQYAPRHILVDRSGADAEGCPYNAKSHERNCVYRRRNSPWPAKLPAMVMEAMMPIEYPPHRFLKCPSQPLAHGVPTSPPHSAHNDPE